MVDRYDHPSTSLLEPPLISRPEQDYEVVCFLANVGQEEPWDEVEKKALKIGAIKMVIVDLQREFVEDLCFRAIQCNAAYEGRYLLGTSLARPVIARAQIKVAQQENCQFVSHGCTGELQGISTARRSAYKI